METTPRKKSNKILAVVIIILLLTLGGILYFWFQYLKPKGITLCQNHYTCSQLEEDFSAKTLICRNFSCQKIPCENNEDCQGYCEAYTKDLMIYKGDPIVSTGFACSQETCSCAFKTAF